MKLRIILFAFIISTFFTANIALATQYYYEQDWHEHNEGFITLIVNDVALVTDIPPIMINNRTLIPARAFFEHLGAQVDWMDGDISITHNSNRLFMRINSRQLILNGRNIHIDEPDPPPMIVMDRTNTERTLIPLRFVSENLGYLVTWDQPTKTVNIRQSIPNNTAPPIQPTPTPTSSSPHIMPNQDGSISVICPIETMPTIFTLASPNRLVADFYDIDMGFHTIPISSAYVDSVRIAFHDTYSRIVFDLKDGVSGNIKPHGGGYLVYFANPGSLSPTPTSNNKTKIVVLDPGHGGSQELGAIGRIDGRELLHEKDANLDISLRVARILSEYPDITLKMTRTQDVYVSLQTRADFANNADADIFVSIHNNSYTTSEPRGTTVYYKTSDKESEKLAAAVQASMVKYIDTKDRGLSDGSRLYVIRNTTMPSILCEGLFLSNPDDLRMLMTDDVREKMAIGIAEGILAYLQI